MGRLKVAQISLAVKCQLLFGSAVLLIIAAALLVPWFQMNKLVDELHKRDALHIAESVRERLDLSGETWGSNEPGVELYRYTPEMLKSDSLDSFLKRAMEGMVSSDPSEFRILREVDAAGAVNYRYALAIRDAAGPEGAQRLLGIVTGRMEARHEQLIQWNHLLILTAGASAGLLAVLVFYLIVTKLILSPVRDLTLVAEQVSRGDLQVRSSILTGDEFEELSETFNRMLASLQNSHEELETINRSLDTRLGELALTNVNLYESHRMQSEFLANVSHELRTPLSSIIGFAELLQDAMSPDGDGDERTRPGSFDEKGARRLRRFAANILTSGRSLLELINDLLDLAKIETGKMQLHRTRFSILDVCHTLIDFTKPLVDKKDLRISLEADGELPELHSDSGKIQQILYNLLSNAIKFTPERGTIALTVTRPDDDHIRVAIRDTGPGIKPEDQTAIFEKFRQLDGSLTREQGGTGLGLPISRELALLLGGSLSLESEVGSGSMFSLLLPLECPERVERPLMPLNR